MFEEKTRSKDSKQKQNCIWCGAKFEREGLYQGHYCEDCRIKT